MTKRGGGGGGVRVEDAEHAETKRETRAKTAKARTPHNDAGNRCSILLVYSTLGDCTVPQTAVQLTQHPQRVVFVVKQSLCATACRGRANPRFPEFARHHSESAPSKDAADEGCVVLNP